MSKCMGLILQFRSQPAPLHIADNRLSASVDVNVFDCDLLLSLALLNKILAKVSSSPVLVGDTS